MLRPNFEQDTEHRGIKRDWCRERLLSYYPVRRLAIESDSDSLSNTNQILPRYAADDGVCR